MGRSLGAIGDDHQVLVVTHLAQVAACASAHCVVHKQHDKVSTVSTVRSVSGEQRITEIARMLGGERLSEATLAHAREMLEHAAPADSATKSKEGFRFLVKSAANPTPHLFA